MTDSFIVTGGAGFIGSNLVKALNRRGHTDILIVDSLDAAGMKERNILDLEYAGYVDKKDFRNSFRCGNTAAVGTVFHLGACSSTTETNQEYLRDNNYGYSRDLCEWSLGNGSRFIYASSAATYGDGSLGYSDSDEVTPTLKPLNLYGQSKQDFDMWALREGLLSRIAGLKYFNVYGPREDHKGDMRSVVNKAYKQIADTGEIGLFKSYLDDYADGEQKRDFVYVRDAVDVTLFFHDNPGVSGLFNCGTGAARTWIDLARAIFAAMEREPVIHFIEMPESIRDKYQYFTQSETEKLRSAGFSAPFTSIEDGVLDYVQSCLSLKKD
jgi:ADP-L-glycero-D-manno-heptose 6-epimerase